MTRDLKLYIDGEFTQGTGEEVYELREAERDGEVGASVRPVGMARPGVETGGDVDRDDEGVAGRDEADGEAVKGVLFERAGETGAEEGVDHQRRAAERLEAGRAAHLHDDPALGLEPRNHPGGVARHPFARPQEEDGHLADEGAPPQEPGRPETVAPVVSRAAEDDDPFPPQRAGRDRPGALPGESLRRPLHQDDPRRAGGTRPRVRLPRLDRPEDSHATIGTPATRTVTGVTAPTRPLPVAGPTRRSTAGCS